MDNTTTAAGPATGPYATADITGLKRALEAGWLHLRVTALDEMRRDDDPGLTAEQFDRTVQWTGDVHASHETGLTYYKVSASGEYRWWANTKYTGFPWDVLDVEDVDMGDETFKRGY